MNPDRKPFSEKFFSIGDHAANTVLGPIAWFREKIVEPNQNSEAWYHRRFRRVPTIDECEVTDAPCYYEAKDQLRRDYRVEARILRILLKRFEDCTFYHSPANHNFRDPASPCYKMKQDYETSKTNFFIKYGELKGPWRDETPCPIDVLMKQKHRLLWEKIHGPVGQGPNPEKELKIPKI